MPLARWTPAATGQRWPTAPGPTTLDLDPRPAHVVVNRIAPHRHGQTCSPAVVAAHVNQMEYSSFDVVTSAKPMQLDERRRRGIRLALDRTQAHDGRD